MKSFFASVYWCIIMRSFRSPCRIQTPSRPVSYTRGWVQIAEQEMLIAVASLVHCCAIKKNVVHHSYTTLLIYSSQQGCQFGFFEARFWNSGFFEHLWLFWKSKKDRKIWLFSVEKAWLWKNIVWAAYSLQISFEKSLWPLQGAKNIEKILMLRQKWSMLLIRNKYTTV